MTDSHENELAKSDLPDRSITDPDLQRAVETTLAPNLQKLLPQERQHVIQEVTMASTEPRTVPFSIRLDTRAKTALDKQAAAQGSPSANLAQWIIVEWLKAHGFIK